jgi:phage baseplate assembly protein W
MLEVFVLEFDVTAVIDGVDFAPASIQAEVLQNVRTILATRVGSVPLDRNFGLSWHYLDKPMPVAQARMQQEVIERIRKYEPRAVVVSVGVEPGNAVEGELRPKVRIRING